MRLMLRWIDQLRRTTVENLPAFCAALTAQLTEMVEQINAWAAIDHNPDGSHAAVKFAEEPQPPVTTGTLAVWWDGTNLKYLKPDGTSGNIV